MQLPVIPQDKANHAVYGNVASAIGGAAAVLLGFPNFAPHASMAAAAAAGLGKGVLDIVGNIRAKARGEPKPHEVSLLDLLATVAGGGPNSGVFYLMVS